MEHFCLALVPFDEVALRAHLAAHGIEAGEGAMRYGAGGEGRSVYVEGKLQTRSYDKDGQKHYATDVVADRVVFLGGGGAGGEGRGGGESRGRSGGFGGRGDSGPTEEPGEGGPAPSDDDIPF